MQDIKLSGRGCSFRGLFFAIQRPLFCFKGCCDDKIRDKSLWLLSVRKQFWVQWVFAKGFYSDFQRKSSFLLPSQKNGRGSRRPLPPAINRVTTGAWMLNKGNKRRRICKSKVQAWSSLHLLAFTTYALYIKPHDGCTLKWFFGFSPWPQSPGSIYRWERGITWWISTDTKNAPPK